MARGRPRTSPEAKAAKKAEKEAANAQNIAADALSKIPEEPERVREFFDELRACKSEARSAAGNTSAQKKRMHEVFGIDPVTTAIIEKLESLKSGRRECVIRQVRRLCEMLGLDAQLDLFNDNASGKTDPDEGSVFDRTGAGAAVGAERGDDPGRASKRRGPPAPPATATPNVGVEGLAAGIKPLETPEEKRARINDQKSADAAVFDKDAKKETAKTDSPAAKVEAMDADTKNMTPAQKRAHAKKIADEVFERQGNKGLGPGAIH